MNSPTPKKSKQAAGKAVLVRAGTFAAVFGIGVLVLLGVVKTLVLMRVAEPSIWEYGTPITIAWLVISVLIALKLRRR